MPRTTSKKLAEHTTRLERLLDDIGYQQDQALRSFALATSSDRYLPQVDNLIQNIIRIQTDCRVILRSLGVE